MPETDNTQSLVVRPKTAQRLLDCGADKLYELIRDGKLESYKDGGSRKILRASIDRYITAKLTAEKASHARRPVEATVEAAG